MKTCTAPQTAKTHGGRYTTAWKKQMNYPSGFPEVEGPGGGQRTDHHLCLGERRVRTLERYPVHRLSLVLFGRGRVFAVQIANEK